MKKGNELKRRARLAKQRLKMGYWETFEEQKAKVIDAVGTTENGVVLANELVREKIKREFKFVNDAQAQKDEILYSKVCAILDSDEIVMNPIGRLVNKDEYERLDDNGRQRYILELSEKFRELQERYYKERRGNII